jgi:hypothetical protein
MLQGQSLIMRHASHFEKNGLGKGFIAVFQFYHICDCCSLFQMSPCFPATTFRSGMQQQCFKRVSVRTDCTLTQRFIKESQFVARLCFSFMLFFRCPLDDVRVDNGTLRILPKLSPDACLRRSSDEWLENFAGCMRHNRHLAITIAI